MYVYGPAGKIAKRTTINNETTTYYYLTDHLGSTRLITDKTGTPLTSVTFYPFGNPDNYTGSAQPYLFTGKEQDATGLYYFNARYYDPETGRFITRDSYTFLPDDPRMSGNNPVQWLINPQRFNRYTYAQNNPLQYTDPTGLSFGSLECCDPDCTYLCADDDAHNSNPGGSEGSPSYPLDPPEDKDNYNRAEKASKKRNLKPAEEASKQKKRAQEECKEECLKDEDVATWLRQLKGLKKEKILWNVGWIAACLIASIFMPLIAIVCGLIAVGAEMHYDSLEEMLIDNLREKGCLCVL